MPLVNDIFGNESMGRKKHGGPLVNRDNFTRSDGLHADGGGFQMWDANGSPWVRSIFRAAPDPDEQPRARKEPGAIKGHESMNRVNDYIAGYKKAMIEQGRESEILPSPAPPNFHVENELPAEMVKNLQEAFASRDEAAMAQAMLACNEYDPRHLSFEDGIQFWVDQFAKIWAPEFDKGKEVAAGFIESTLDPYKPPEFDKIKRDCEARERYEEVEEQARMRRLQKKMDNGYDPNNQAPIDLTDSSLSIIQAKSSNMEWETTALMGGHPGVMFGAHCAAGVEALDFAAVSGDPEYAHPESIDFNMRYPQSKGREALGENKEELIARQQRIVKDVRQMGLLDGKYNSFVIEDEDWEK